MVEAYICDAARTPIGRYGGSLAHVRPDDLAAIPLRALAERNPSIVGSIDDVIIGCANQAGEDNRNVARMAALLSGLGESAPGTTLIGINDFDFIELNEAFASQGLAVLRQLGLPDQAEHVNPNGGAIALGHPLGMSGARLVLTAAQQLVETGSRRALCTMCIGVGQGIALAIEAV